MTDLDKLIDSIRLAVVDGATAEARTAGAAACRAVLGALEATPGRPMPQSIAPPSSRLARLLDALNGVPPEQIAAMLRAQVEAFIAKTSGRAA
jgi:hypothetical protein